MDKTGVNDKRFGKVGSANLKFSESTDMFSLTVKMLRNYRLSNVFYHVYKLRPFTFRFYFLCTLSYIKAGVSMPSKLL